MSNYLILKEISEALRAILWHSFESDPQIRQIVPSEDSITFLDPEQASHDNCFRLSLWLYRVAENGFLRNQTPPPGGSRAIEGTVTTRTPSTPVPLDVFYLVTPLATPHDGDLPLMGKVLQVLNDNAIFLVKDPESGSVEELRLLLQSLPMNELSLLWDSLRQPYRLSASYLVRIVQIDSERSRESARVVERFDDNEERRRRRRGP